MGLNNEGADRHVVIDIETVGLPDAAEFMEPIEAPSNYKDPLKIAAYQAEKQAEQLERAGLDLDLCEVVCVGWQEAHDRQPRLMHRGLSDETTLLVSIWQVLQSAHVVGFNVIGFDLPVLQRRSLYLGIPMPRIPVDKYRHPTVTDLAQILSYNGSVKMRGLAFYCKRFGIPHDDTFTGADVAAAVKAGNWEAIGKHCADDIAGTRALAERLGILQPQLTF